MIAYVRDCNISIGEHLQVQRILLLEKGIFPFKINSKQNIKRGGTQKLKLLILIWTTFFHRQFQDGRKRRTPFEILIKVDPLDLQSVSEV